MDITFSNNKLKKYAENESTCKKLGEVRSKLYMVRLRDLLSAETLEDVRYLPGHYHELVENRKGQWACETLTNHIDLSLNPMRIRYQQIKMANTFGLR